MLGADLFFLLRIFSRTTADYNPIAPTKIVLINDFLLLFSGRRKMKQEKKLFLPSSGEKEENEKKKKKKELVAPNLSCLSLNFFFRWYRTFFLFFFFFFSFFFFFFTVENFDIYIYLIWWQHSFSFSFSFSFSSFLFWLENKSFLSFRLLLEQKTTCWVESLSSLSFFFYF